MAMIIIAGLFLLIGYLSGSYSDRFLFLKASLALLVMLVLAFFAIVMATVINYLVVVKLLGQNMDAFTFGVMDILLAGVFNFFFVRFVFRLTRNDSTLIELEEYYIQWTTIFFTLYQFFTSSPSNMENVRKLSLSTRVLNIDLLNIIILPVLLVSWIAIAMTKVYLKDHHS
ncbi:SA1002 family membrane protein [Weissella halotolerans]|uniref:Uncharacterized protein n=1 Tax=Weissella halotolerans DSM 20190 TaxID=1123500 RepID=A0A0R2G035_9LACO|nr:hypothetical protein [Weissella halotolerans]KRN30810.1 hypothetical protein IV68_GL001237 [Weissella halotolerans DSM 20190]